MYTSKQVVLNARESFTKGLTKPIKFREKQLKNFLKFFQENEDELYNVMYQDSKKAKEEAKLEVNLCKNHLEYILDNIRNWIRVEKPQKRIHELPFDIYIYKEPYGVVLVMGTWNVPLLTLMPVAGAIAAGNCVIIKPSHNSPNLSNFLAKKLPYYLDFTCYPIYIGGIKATNELLEEKFDYIYYTGSKFVGKLVHKAANKFLTPVTLELGGKNPVYIDKTVNLEIATKRILWGKFFNAGQACISPDYILCTSDIRDDFIATARRVISAFFTDNPQISLSYSRIINTAHFERLYRLMKNLKVAVGGTIDKNDNYIEPTLVIDVNLRDEIMQEEIFGPILPVISVKNKEEAIDIINGFDKPLALYVFSKEKKIIDFFIENTSSGGMAINETIFQLLIENLPFGGVGASGMGCYKGRDTFDTFSHKKSVLVGGYSTLIERILSVRYPPYTERKSAIMAFGIKYRKRLNWGVYLFIILIITTISIIIYFMIVHI